MNIVADSNKKRTIQAMIQAERDRAKKLAAIHADLITEPDQYAYSSTAKMLLEIVYNGMQQADRLGRLIDIADVEASQQDAREGR
jgi:hypothetical protein